MRLKDFANVIKAARLDKKYSQKQVADFVGISKSGYSQIESGRKNPSATILIMICYMLDIFFGDFIDTPEDAAQEYEFTEDDLYVDLDSVDAEDDEQEENEGWFR